MEPVKHPELICAVRIGPIWPDFHEKTQFFRVIRGAIVRVDADVLTSPIRGLVHPGEIVMALEFSDCNANEHGKGDKVVQRVRI